MTWMCTTPRLTSGSGSSGRRCSGRDTGPRRLPLVVEYALDVAGLHRVSLEVYDFNPRAQRVYEKCGFTVEGRLRDALLMGRRVARRDLHGDPVHGPAAGPGPDTRGVSTRGWWWLATLPIPPGAPDCCWGLVREVAMRAGAMLLHAQLRQHWKSWLALAALVALVGGFVLAAAATGRRTAARLPGLRRPAWLRRRRLQQPAAAAPGPGPHPPGGPGDDGARPRTPSRSRCAPCRKPIDPGDFDVLEVPPASLPRHGQAAVRADAGPVPPG